MIRKQLPYAGRIVADKRLGDAEPTLRSNSQLIRLRLRKVRGGWRVHPCRIREHTETTKKTHPLRPFELLVSRERKRRSVSKEDWLAEQYRKQGTINTVNADRTVNSEFAAQRIECQAVIGERLPIQTQVRYASGFEAQSDKVCGEIVEARKD